MTTEEFLQNLTTEEKLFIERITIKYGEYTDKDKVFQIKMFRLENEKIR